MTSFAAGITSGAINIDISYSGVLYIESPNSSLNRYFTTDDQYDDLIIHSFDFSPKTACEPANYTFELTTTNI